MKRLGGFALVLYGVLTACTPPAQPVREDRLTVQASDVWSVEVDARLPTDLLPVPEGGFWVLDGYRGRAVLFDRHHAEVGAVGNSEDWGRPVRMASARQDGFWLVQPDTSSLLRSLPTGEVVETLILDEGFEPITVLDAGDALITPTRTGEIVWADPTSGKTIRVVEEDVDGVHFGAVTDVVQTADGGLIVADSLGPRVHELDGEGTPLSWFGRHGMWAGYQMKPKGIAIGPDDTTLVADSALGVVQLFDPHAESASERALGMVAVDGEPMAFEHAIAVERLGDSNDYLVLDMLGETVWGFTLTPAAVGVAREAATVRSLRDPLVEHEGFLGGVGAKTCLECHDGLLNDDRENWDPDRVQHPVDVVPERDLPAFFPVDDAGEMRCATCHSPHGTSTMEEVATVRRPDEIGQLVRHAPEEDLFTRLTRHDAALCMACHDKDPHKAAADAAGITGEGHPSGTDLLEKLEEKIEEARASGDTDLSALEDLPKGCLACHSVHGASGKSLGRGAADGQVCIACHEAKVEEEVNHPILNDLFDEDGERLPFARREAKLPMASNGGTTCLSCHDLVTGFGDTLLRTPADGGVVCAVCHLDQDLGDPEVEDEHGNTRGAHAKIDTDGALPCMGCHSPHDTPAEGKFLTTVEGARGGDIHGCLTCHGPGGQAERDGVMPGRYGHPVTGRRHRGLDGPLTCASCHDPHQPEAGAQAKCTRCHEDRVAAVEAGGHGDAKCADCHTVHKRPPVAYVPGESYNARTLRCLGCHGLKTGKGADTPRIIEIQHPDLRLKAGRKGLSEIGDLRLFGTTGQQLAPGKKGDITCSTCHRTHSPHPTNPLDKLRRPGVQDSCEECHGEEADARYKYFHEPEKRAFLDVWAP